MYGSVKLKGINRVQEIDPSISNKEAGVIVEHVREFINIKCNRIFKFKSCMIKLIKHRVKHNKPLLLNLQGNHIKYEYRKLEKKRTRIRINNLDMKINNQFNLIYPINKIDTSKASRTILTTLIHSLDAKINVEFRIAFKKFITFLYPPFMIDLEVYHHIYIKKLVSFIKEFYTNKFSSWN